MGRKLRNKLPKMQMRAEPMDELQWQMQIRERMRGERGMRKSMQTRREVLRSATLRLATG